MIPVIASRATGTDIIARTDHEAGSERFRSSPIRVPRDIKELHSGSPLLSTTIQSNLRWKSRYEIGCDILPTDFSQLNRVKKVEARGVEPLS
jgi:hypothetical protein